MIIRLITEDTHITNKHSKQMCGEIPHQLWLSDMILEIDKKKNWLYYVLLRFK
jgi:hypothetical protein